MRKAISLVLYLFALGVFSYSAFMVYNAYLGVPEGLTGGRASVALPGHGRLEVQGGFVRRVDGTQLAVRSLSPSPVLRFENEGQEDASFSISLGNVRPATLRAGWFDSHLPLADREPLQFNLADPGVVRFTVQIPAGGGRTYAFEQAPASPGTVRFFVFAGVRKGVGTFQRILDLANRESPDFIVGLGDIYYRAQVANILALDRRLALASVPVYLLPGEIEYRSPESSEDEGGSELGRFYVLDRHSSMFGRGDNAFSFGDWRFVFMDNALPRNRRSLWRLARLPPGDPAAPRTVFFSHIPPFDPRREIFKNDMPTGSPGEHRRMTQEMIRLGAAVAFFGHYHGYAEGLAAGIPCYVTSAAGTKLPEGETSHFLDVTLRDGRAVVIRRDLEPRPSPAAPRRRRPAPAPEVPAA